MPLVIKIPQNQEIEVLGVTLRAEGVCHISLNDHSVQFVKATATTPRRIVRKETDA